jgi:copper transport protein
MRSRPRRGGGRLAAILIAAAVVVIVGAVPASAHSSLERSEPPHGGKVAVGRTTLTLWFSEPISPQASIFDLQTRDGVEEAITVAISEGVVEITTDPLAQEVYELDWAVLSLEDGHIERGSVVFGVGITPDVVLDADTSLPGTPELMLRWLDLVVLMLVMGALAVSGRVLGSIGTSGTAVRDHANYIGAIAAGAAVITGALTPFFRVPRGDLSIGAWLDTTLDTLTGTPWGQLWMWREIALVILAVVLWHRIRRDSDSRVLVQVAFVTLVAVMGLEAWAGHASALPRQSGLAALVSATHFAAAGVWAGGLAVLALCLVPVMRRNSDTRGPMLASAWRAFSPMAAIATVVLVATGLYESGRHLPDTDAIFSTVYGGGVAAKIALIAVALVLAGFNTLLINPRLAAPVARLLGQPAGWAPVSLRRFTTVVVAEALILLVAVAAAALLTSVASAREIEAAGEETTPQTASVEDVFVTFEVVPAGAEQSRLIVRTRSTARPEPAPISGVTALVESAGGTATNVPLNIIELGRHEAETAKLGPGVWRVSVAIERNPLPDAVTQFAWTVPDDIPEGARPFEVVTTMLAVLMLVALAVAIRSVQRRRETPTDLLQPVYERSEILP